jgi:hypothetical protein
METSDVTVKLDGRPFAYLCVFNGGEWVAIHWARVEGGAATFTRMGRDIVYLPAWFDGKDLLPAGHPLLLRGDVTTLPGTGPLTTLAAAVERGKTCELFRWSDGWQKVGEGAAGDGPLLFEGLPADGLYWLVERGSRKLERIFTIEDGKQKWW